MNKAAQALARLRRGIKERPSAGKRSAAKRNLAAARQKRWPKPDARTPNESSSPTAADGNGGSQRKR